MVSRTDSDVSIRPPLLPRALRPGARVALVAPAGPLDPERIDAAADRCRALGWEPVTGSRVHHRRGFLAGEDAARLQDLQDAFSDPTVDAVWSLRGGYGSGRLLDALDLDRQRRDPIPFIGFSDNTALHARHAALGIVSFHGPHPTFDDTPEADAWLQQVLTDPRPAGAVPNRAGDPPARAVVPGRAEGRLAGGNLSLVASLCGTRDSIDARGSILVLEDVGEPPYRLDRMLLQLRRAGVMEGVRGLALGRFTAVPDGQDESAMEVLAAFARDRAVPTVVDLPFGHTPHNCVLPLGVLARLDADTATLTLLEAAVR